MSEGWKIVLGAAWAIAIATALVLGIREGMENAHEQRSQQHWADIAACEEANGTVYLKSSGWFAYCELL